MRIGGIKLSWQSLHKLTEYATAQGLAQLVSMVAGVLIVRTLSKPDYALFILANSMYVTSNLLSDLGVGLVLRKEGAKAFRDHPRLNQLASGALALRRKFAGLLMILATGVFIWLFHKNQAGPWQILWMCFLINLAFFPSLGTSIAVSVFQVIGQTKKLQKLDLVAAFTRLGILGLLACKGISGLLVALFAMTGANIVQSVIATRERIHLLGPVVAPASQDLQEMTKVSWQMLPNTIFTCFQGQVMFWILSCSGNSTGIADVGAIGRIAALLFIVSMIAGNVIVPKFARIQRYSEVKFWYGSFPLLTGLLLLPLVLGAWWMPNVFLWILGDKYHGLGDECSLLILAAVATQVVGLWGHMNLSRGWLRWYSIGCIPSTILLQVILAWNLDLRQVHDLLVFNLVTTCATLPVIALDGWLGLRKLKDEEKLQSH